MLLALVSTASALSDGSKGIKKCDKRDGICRSFLSDYADKSNEDSTYKNSPRDKQSCMTNFHCTGAIPYCGNHSYCMRPYAAPGCDSWDSGLGPGNKVQTSCGHTAEPALLPSCQKWELQHLTANGWNEGDTEAQKRTAMTKYCATQMSQQADYTRHSRWPDGKGKCFFGQVSGVQKMNGYYECGCSQTTCEGRSDKFMEFDKDTGNRVWQECKKKGVPRSKEMFCRSSRKAAACFCPGANKDASNFGDWDPTCECMYAKSQVNNDVSKTKCKVCSVGSQTEEGNCVYREIAQDGTTADIPSVNEDEMTKPVEPVEPAWPAGTSSCETWTTLVNQSGNPLQWCADDVKLKHAAQEIPHFVHEFTKTGQWTYKLVHGVQQIQIGSKDADHKNHFAEVCGCKQTICDTANAKCWTSSYIPGCFHSKHRCTKLGTCQARISDAGNNVSNGTHWCHSCGNAVAELSHVG